MVYINKRSRWPSIDASTGQVLMLAVAKGSASLHFLEITKNTFNTYVKDGVFVEGVHFVKDGNSRIFVPNEIIGLKKSGIKGNRKSLKKQDKLDAVNLQLGIMPMCRSAV